MLNIFDIKFQLNWPSARAHICTVAVALSFNSTWRVPRDAFRYGGVAYGLVFTVAMVAVALPTALLQLAVGQLSQQDAVGIWRAVPFFKGVGYLRLLITFLGSIYTVIYAGITTTAFFYSINNSSDTFREADETFILESDNTSLYNTSIINGTILEPVQEQPEHYVAMAMVTSLLWVLFPVILYSPVKFMKKIFYGAVPVVLALALAVVSCLGDRSDICRINNSTDWVHLGQPDIWHSAVIQALWSAQIAGGYLISTGDTVYSCTDVHWTTAIFVIGNILASWFGLILWYAIGGSGEKDTTVLAVLEQTYRLVEEKNLSALWQSLVFAFLMVSGVITVLTLLYPLYDRFKRFGRKWRYMAAGSSLVGAGAAWAMLAVGLPGVTVLDDTVVPILISITTMLEICPFIFIYGWRNLIEDIEFLVGRQISPYWMWGWCVAVGSMLCSSVWWLVSYILEWSWVNPKSGGIVAAASAAVAILLTLATISVLRQVQYDVIGKLKSSFRPSRHWGPRDPITHYYWLARRREDIQLDQPRTRYNRRQLGQFSGNLSFLNANITQSNITDKLAPGKRRSNSDDWLYIYRKQNMAEMCHENIMKSKKRSKSLVLSGLDIKKYGQKKELSTTDIEVASAKSVVSVHENSKYIERM